MKDDDDGGDDEENLFENIYFISEYEIKLKYILFQFYILLLSILILFQDSYHRG